MRTRTLALGLFGVLCLWVNCTGEEEQEPVPVADADRIRLCISGTLQGRLEPCGCAAAQLGGLARRSFYLQSGEPHDILIEGGDLVTGGTELDALKLYTALQVLAMPAHRYDALGIGPSDLALSREEYAMFVGGLQVPAVSSDLVAGPLASGIEWPARSHIEVDVRGTPVRIASLTMSLPATPASGELSLLPPEQAWTRALQGAAPETLRILMVHAGPDRVREMAALTPSPDLVIGITPAIPEPPAEHEEVDGVPVVFPGTRGRILLELTLARLPEGPRIGYRPIQLKGSETVKGAMEDQGVKGIILAHRYDVQSEGVLEQLAEARPTRTGARYVGTRACAECHVADHDIWKDTRHARAWQTLVEAEADPTRYGWPVTAYPDCVGCHVVGYGEQSGFVNVQRTPLLKDVGCEACHGPGSAHVESGGESRMGRVGPQGCIGCHDFEQTPDFDFAELWKLIEHFGG